MANTAGICNNFKFEVMTGIHALGPGTGVPARTAATADVVKCALFLASGSLSPSTTTAYSATSEVANSGSYTAGGATVTTAKHQNPNKFQVPKIKEEPFELSFPRERESTT